MALTRIQIVNEALGLAQLDSGFQTKARLWLNIVLAKLALRTRYKFYNKTVDTSFVAGQSSYTLPVTYQRSDSMYLLDANGNQGQEIFLVEPYDFDASNWPTTNGTPTMAMIDLEGGVIRFNATPVDGTQKFRLRYFRKAGQYSTDNMDDAVTVDFEDQDLLIQELTAYAMKYTDDERYLAQKAEVKESHVDHRRNMYESEGTGTVPLAHENFRGRSGARNGSFR